jgi:hypothetical protein
MAPDNAMAPVRRLLLLRMLDGTRPSGALQWVSPVAVSVTQAAIGSGHWAAGRRRRALAAWTAAAGFGLVAWGLGTEAPTRAETDENIERQKDLLREGGTQVPATAETTTRLSRRSLDALDATGSLVRMVFGVRSGLRQPRRPTARAIADEAPTVVFYALRAARAIQRRKPRMAAGSALIVAGSVARLRAASAEPRP